MKKLFKSALLLAVVFLSLPLSVNSAKKIKVHTLGDSTTTLQDEKSNKRGWAQMFTQFLTGDATVNNTAKSGTSSKSFYPDLWTNKTLPSVEAGDYVFICFGHNDEKAGGMDGDSLMAEMNAAGRTDLAQSNAASVIGTAPSTSYRYWLQKYVDDVKAVGAIPVIITPICRNQWDQTTGTVRRDGHFDLGAGCAIHFNTAYDGTNDMYVRGTCDESEDTYDYRRNAIAVAQANNIDYIDLTSITANMMNAYGQTWVSNNWFCQNVYDENNSIIDKGDGTHPSPLGASLIARACAQELQRKGILTEYLNVDAPILVNPANNYDFGKCYVGGNQLKEFSVAAYDIIPAAGTMTLSVTNGFEISDNQTSGFSNQLAINYTDGNLAYTYLYVRACPTTGGVINGTLTVSNGTETTVTVALSVEGLDVQGAKAASCVWNLYKNTTTNYVTTGSIHGFAESFSNMKVSGYAGDMTWPEGHSYATSKPAIQQVAIDADAWPTTEIDEVADRYVQFAIEAPQDTVLYVDSIGFWMTSRGTSNICAKVVYSRDESFAQASNIAYVQGFTAKTPVWYYTKPVEVLNPGEKLYVRVLPWSPGGKGTISLCDMTFHAFAVGPNSTDEEEGVQIPTASDTYIDWNECVLENANIENNGANIGSTRSNTVATFTLVNSVQQDYVLTFKTGASNGCTAEIDVVLTNSNTAEQVFADVANVLNTGSWTPSTKHEFEIANLPVGTYTLRLSTKQILSGSYAGNWGDLALYTLTDAYDVVPGTLRLSKGTYTGSIRTENDATNVGWIKNGDVAAHPFIVSQAGVYKLTLPLARYNESDIAISISDDETGVEEATAAHHIGANDPGVYTDTEITLLGAMTAGHKTMTLTFTSESSSYLCNYQAPTLSFFASQVAKITDITIAGQTVTKGTKGDFYVNLPNTYTADNVVFVPTIENATAVVTAVSGLTYQAVTVTDNGDGSYAVATPAGNRYTDVTIVLNTEEGTKSEYEQYTLHIFKEGDVALQSKSIKFITEQLNSTSTKWQYGLWELSTSDGSFGGWSGQAFYFNQNKGQEKHYTWTMPANIVVKQIILHEFHAGYDNAEGIEGEFTSMSSTGATTYLPAKHTYAYGDSSIYDLAINIDGHVAGTPIQFSITGGWRPIMWYEFVYEQYPYTGAPALLNKEVTVDGNNAVVTLTFNHEMQPATATVGSQSVHSANVNPDGQYSDDWNTLTFTVWGLDWNSSNTFTLASANGKDQDGNALSADVTANIVITAPAALETHAYDYVVSNYDELKAAIDAVNASNTAEDAERKVIFLKNGTYSWPDKGTKVNDASETKVISEVITITAHNLSLVGQSMESVKLMGRSEDDGHGSAMFNPKGKGLYMQDLWLQTEHWRSGHFNGRVLAINGNHEKAVLKRVALLGQQDTYLCGHRTYHEDCIIAGTVDYIYSGGDNYFQHCDIVLENRGGDVITAPGTSKAQYWGLVFNNCTIKAAPEAPDVTDGSFTLGRPWQNEPRNYWLNTTMEVLPANRGWNGMSGVYTHMYEYNSLNAEGNAIDLSVRENPSSSYNHYTPVLTDAQAELFTIKNVLGGEDAWDAASECVLLDAPNASRNGNTISWSAVNGARCYVIFQDGEYIASVAGTSYTLENVNPIAVYTIATANQNGGLGQPAEIKDTATGIESQVLKAGSDLQKLIKNGQLFIIRDGRTYNVLGHEVK